MAAAVTDTEALEDAARTRDVERMLGRLVEPGLADLAVQLRSLGTLSAREQEVVREGAAAALRSTLWRRVSRTVVLELNAARLRGTLPGADPRDRWNEWVASLARPGAWEALAEPYPSLLPRLRRLIDNRCAAALTLARRFGHDRAALPALLGGEPGELSEVSFGAGDSHQGGQTVAPLRCGAGRLVYKPRPVAADAVLAELLPRLLPDEPADTRIRVPEVLVCRDAAGGYGWAAHVPHRYCTDDRELSSFYRGLGHWLAVMRLLGGSDLHFENLVADGPVPVVVDCETLFTPHHAVRDFGYGAAVGLAAHRIAQSVLRTGLLPGRGAALGWRGGDPSGAGRLPGQQPVVRLPTIVDHGTDRARVEMASVPAPAGTNLPSPDPDLRKHWPSLVDAFSELTAALLARDRAGELAPLLAGFADCPVRVVVRDTASYAELERMLWHPTSLHRPEPALARAAELLAEQAENRPGVPDDPAVIQAELAELLDGDVPMFVTTPGSGALAGPRGTRWGTGEDLVSAALDSWRGTDPATERQVIQAAVVSAYLNLELAPPKRSVRATRPRADGLDRRRRGLAADLLRRVAQTAVRGEDGTATWVSLVLDETGWAVRPLGPDLYAGLAGVAVLLAGYQREVAAGRADPVPGLAGLQDAVLATLRLAEDRQERERERLAEAGIRARPPPCGGYLGLGSWIWSWLLLHDLGAVPGAEAIRRATAAAARVPEAVAADETYDLLGGAAGAVVPLLRLAERTGTGRWRELAGEVGHRLQQVARRSPAGAHWPRPQEPEGIGGLSHGVTGIGWALARAGAATGDAALGELADAAFAREEAWYDPQRGGWQDARASAAAAITALWCHGSVGIGIAAADLLGHDPRDGRGDHLADLLQRAGRASWPAGFGSNHTLCHGDLSAWELLDRAWAAGLGPSGVDRGRVTAEVLTSLEEHGATSGLTREVFSPALMSGLGGTAYQLLRMHPECDLPSVLLPDPAPGPARGRFVEPESSPAPAAGGTLSS